MACKGIRASLHHMRRDALQNHIRYDDSTQLIRGFDVSWNRSTLHRLQQQWDSALARVSTASRSCSSKAVPYLKWIIAVRS